MQAFPSFRIRLLCGFRAGLLQWAVVYVQAIDRGKEEEVEVMFSCSPSLTANCPHCMQTLEFFGASRETLTFCLEAINYLDKKSRT